MNSRWRSEGHNDELICNNHEIFATKQTDKLSPRNVRLTGVYQLHRIGEISVESSEQTKPDCLNLIRS